MEQTVLSLLLDPKLDPRKIKCSRVCCRTKLHTRVQDATSSRCWMLWIQLDAKDQKQDTNSDSDAEDYASSARAVRRHLQPTSHLRKARPTHTLNQTPTQEKNKPRLGLPQRSTTFSIQIHKGEMEKPPSESIHSPKPAC